MKKKVWENNRTGEKCRLEKQFQGFRWELTGRKRMIGTHREKDWEAITNLACLGAFTHNQSAVCGNIGGIVIDIQDLDCDWYIAHQIWIVWKTNMTSIQSWIFSVRTIKNNWQNNNEWLMYEGFHMIEVMPYQDTLVWSLNQQYLLMNTMFYLQYRDIVTLLGSVWTFNTLTSLFVR